MSTQQTLLVALLGGIGGAFLTGVFNAAVGLLADRRRQRHELDAWLRDKRFHYTRELFELTRRPVGDEFTTTDERDAWIQEVDHAVAGLRTVAPNSLTDELAEFVRVVREESPKLEPIRKHGLAATSVADLEDKLRPFLAISWQAGHLHGRFVRVLGWDLDPIGAARERRWYKPQLRNRSR